MKTLDQSFNPISIINLGFSCGYGWRNWIRIPVNVKHLQFPLISPFSRVSATAEMSSAKAGRFARLPTPILSDCYCANGYVKTEFRALGRKTAFRFTSSAEFRDKSYYYAFRNTL